jgi:hypothetical protein
VFHTKTNKLHPGGLFAIATTSAFADHGADDIHDRKLRQKKLILGQDLDRIVKAYAALFGPVQISVQHLLITFLQ